MASATFTYVNQLDEEAMLDVVAFVGVVGGHIERIKEIEARPGIYSILAQIARDPLTAQVLDVSCR